MARLLFLAALFACLAHFLLVSLLYRGTLRRLDRWTHWPRDPYRR